MSVKQDVLKLAKSIGVGVDYGGSGVDFEVVLTCPKGLRFEPGRHTAVNAIWDDMNSRDCWKGALEDLRNGVEPCDDPECEWCSDEWGPE